MSFPLPPNEDQRLAELRRLAVLDTPPEKALDAITDDYLIKPFDKEELHARILVGLRMMTLQAALVARLKDLETAAAEISDFKLQLAI